MTHWVLVKVAKHDQVFVFDQTVSVIIIIIRFAKGIIIITKTILLLLMEIIFDLGIIIR